MNSEDLQIILSDEIKDILEQRGVRESEIRDVISSGLNGGIHLYTSNKDKYLAKKRIDKFTVYVEYTMEDDTFKVGNVYSHRVSLSEEQ